MPQTMTPPAQGRTRVPKQFRALIIAPEQKLGVHFEQACSDIRLLRILRTIPRYPSKEELIRLMRIYVPHVLFVQAQNVDAVLEIHQIAAENAPGLQVVALTPTCDSDMLLALMRRGVKEVLYTPFTRDQIWDFLIRVNEHFQAHPAYLIGTDLLYAFLPSKPGVGATTLAVNTAGALSKDKDMRTFLGDFDLNCGLVRFVLQLTNSHSLLDAIDKADEIDESVWPQLVTSFGSLDVMHAGGVCPDARMDSIHFGVLLEYLRRAYKVICADLSGTMDKYSLSVMHEAKQIFVVTTPELPALHLAREKVQFLTELDLGDRISILLNRVSKDAVLGVDEIESLVGRPVLMSFPNDYRAVHQAVAAGTFMNANSPLAKQCAVLAKSMALGKDAEPLKIRRRFVEYFSILPATYKFERS